MDLLRYSVENLNQECLATRDFGTPKMAARTSLIRVEWDPLVPGQRAGRSPAGVI